MPRWSDTPHIIHDSQWFYSKYKDDDHVVTWNSNSPKKKKRESNTKSNSESNLNNIYIGRENELIDLNYNYINLEEKSINNIEVQGVLTDKSVKTFRGTIDFKEGSKKSIGHENENCLLLSNECISKSLPILLCHEEEVDGTHSVSSGKIDKDKLFYLMTRNLSELDAKRLIIKSNFNHILNSIPEELRETILNEIDEII